MCSKKKMLEDGEMRVSQELGKLTLEQRAEYNDQEVHRCTRRIPLKPIKLKVDPKNHYKYAKEEERYLREIEAWEIKCLDLRIDANKTRLKRIRQKSGSNSRKNSK